MSRKFASNLLFLITANLLIKPYWIFGIDRVVQNKVGAAEYGTYFAVFNYSFLLSIILDFGINNFNNRAVSRDNKRLGEYLLNLLIVKTVLSLLYFAVTMATALLAGFDSNQMWMLLFLAVNQILLSAILYFRSNIAALQLFKTDSIISVLDRLLAIIFCMLLMFLPVFKDSFNVMWFIYAQTLAMLITAIASYWVVAGRTTIQFNFWKIKFTRMILVKSAPFALLVLLMGIYYRIDAVMIERMLPDGEHEAGVYAASFRLLDAVNQFGYLFATLLLPMFAGMIRRNEDTRHLVKFSSELMFALTVIVGVSCYAFSSEIMQLLYRDSNDYWYVIFGWLMLNFIPMGSIYIYGTLLTAEGSLKILNMIAVGGMALNVGLNLYLIPHYGALGATIATLITQIVAAIAHIMATNRRFGYEFDWKEAVKLSVFSVVCYGVLCLARMAPFGWVIDMTLGLAICTGIAIAIRLVPIHEFTALLKSKAIS